MDSDAARGETAGDAGGNAGMGKTQTASKATITSKKDTETTAGKKKGRLAGLKQGLKGCSNFLYDREKKTVMGRGGRRWAMLCIFYILFYLSIFALFLCLIAIIMYSLDTGVPTNHWTPEDDRPYWDGSRLQANPAVIFYPVADREKNPESPLIWITKDNAHYWANKVHEQVEGYNKTGCKGCFQPVWRDDKEGCDTSASYGYDMGKPIFLIRMTRMLKWEPEEFKSPEALEKYITKDLADTSLGSQKNFIIEHFKPNMMYIVCEGETPWDNGLLGHITYCTGIGVDKKYFPFKSKEKYLAPFVAVQFKNAVPGIPISVECYPLAANIKPDKKKGHGMEKFEFMIDI